MPCLDMQMALQAYVDGELSAERAALLEQHLTGCRECQVELARLQAVMTALETWPLVVEPMQLTDRIMRQVRSRPALPAFRFRWSDLPGGSRVGLCRYVMLARPDLDRLEPAISHPHVSATGDAAAGGLAPGPPSVRDRRHNSGRGAGGRCGSDAHRRSGSCGVGPHRMATKGDICHL